MVSTYQGSISWIKIPWTVSYQRYNTSSLPPKKLATNAEAPPPLRPKAIPQSQLLMCYNAYTANLQIPHPGDRTHRARVDGESLSSASVSSTQPRLHRRRAWFQEFSEKCAAQPVGQAEDASYYTIHLLSSSSKPIYIQTSTRLKEVLLDHMA